jgi:hypothetical protein
MAAKYQEAQDDPELLSLRSEIALLDARIAELFERVDTGESGAIWDALQKEWATFRLHRSLGDVPKMHTSMAKLDLLMDRKLTDTAAHREITEKIEQRRKLCETEQKRLVTSQQMINSTEAMVLVAKLTDIVTRSVLAIPQLLPPEALPLQSSVAAAAKKALSQVVVELQQILVRDQTPVYAEVSE